VKDGVRREVVDDHAYYIQGVANGNDCALWWKPHGYGYTCNLDEAGVFFGAELRKLMGTVGDQNVAWPVDWVRARTIPHVRVADLRRGSLPTEPS
jgi:hypothetical protein